MADGSEGHLLIGVRGMWLIGVRGILYFWPSRVALDVCSIQVNQTRMPALPATAKPPIGQHAECSAKA